jgi:hypothetical protein
MSYTSSTTPGAWREANTSTSAEAPCPTGGAVTPGWGAVAPFAIDTAAQFRQPPPGGFYNYADLLASSYYADQLNDVKDIGEVGSSTRTSDQEEAAWFWANDLIGTYKPPGQLLEHTKLVALTQPAADTSGDPEDFVREWSRQGIRVARLFAEVSLALADGGITSWYTKFNTDIDLWRPITAIRDAELDGNNGTQDDDTWEPLSRDRDENHFSPCFPAYVSGHATFAGAWSRVLENEFALASQNTDPFPLTLTTEDPHSETYEGSGVFDTRDFDSFAEAAEEDADSRVWLGVHYPFDAEFGLVAGRGVGDTVTRTALRWAQTCPGWSCAESIP